LLLELSTTHTPATDLGYLLHKHPDRAQSFKLSFGQAHVFYPEASDTRCTAALLLDVDPVRLVRGKGAAQQYVNDRPYVASSFLSVAIAQVFRTALAGRCEARPELAATPLPLELRISVLPCRGGDGLLRRLFCPLGYELATERHGDSPYHSVTLSHTLTVQQMLGHCYVLMPVLDNDKHYWVGQAEVEKLMRHGEGWLASHPEREEISLRYLKHQRRLARDLLRRLAEEDEPDPDALAASVAAEAETVEQPLRLNDLRLQAVRDALLEVGATRILDLGCGEGKLLRELLKQPGPRQIVGLDVSWRAL